MFHARVVVLEYFLQELASIRGEARELLASPAKYLDARLTVKGKWGGIYERYAQLVPPISIQFVDLPHVDWKPPLPSESLFRPDLLALQANSTLLTAALTAMPLFVARVEADETVRRDGHSCTELPTLVER